MIYQADPSLKEWGKGGTVASILSKMWKDREGSENYHKLWKAYVGGPVPVDEAFWVEEHAKQHAAWQKEYAEWEAQKKPAKPKAEAEDKGKAPVVDLFQEATVKEEAPKPAKPAKAKAKSKAKAKEEPNPDFWTRCVDVGGKLMMVGAGLVLTGGLFGPFAAILEHGF